VDALMFAKRTKPKEKSDVVIMIFHLYF